MTIDDATDEDRTGDPSAQSPARRMTLINNTQVKYFQDCCITCLLPRHYVNKPMQCTQISSGVKNILKILDQKYEKGWPLQTLVFPIICKSGV